MTAFFTKSLLVSALSLALAACQTTEPTLDLSAAPSVSAADKRAAERAVRLAKEVFDSNPLKARDALKSAVALNPLDPALWNFLGRAHLELDEDEAAKIAFERARLLSHALDDFVQLARSHLFLGDTERRLRHYRSGEIHYQKALEAAEKEEDRFLSGHAYQRLGLASADAYQLDKAETQFRTALTLFDELGRDLHQGDASMNLGQIALEKGAFAEARALVTGALTLYQGIKNQKKIVRAMTNLGRINLAAGDFDTAEAILYKALAVGESGDHWEEIGRTMMQLAALFKEQDNPGAACAFQEEAVNAFRKAGQEETANALLDIAGESECAGAASI